MAAENVSFKSLLGQIAVYLFLLVFVTWPAITNLALPASPPEGDRGANVWNLWWTAHALQTGTDPRWTPLIFHPWGCSLIHHSLSLTNGLLLAPLTLTLGPAATYGLAFFLWSIVTGVGGIMWSRRWLKYPEDQWLVGFFLVFSAYRFAHLDHLNLFTTAGIPWCFWAFDRLKENDRFRHGLICALLWILTTFSCWYYGVVVGLYGFCRFWGSLRREATLVNRAVVLFPFVAVGMVVWAYLGIPVSGQVATPDAISIGTRVYWSLSVDALLRPLWLYPTGVEPEFRIHPGIVFLLLALVQVVRGLRSREERMPFLLWMAALYAILSLGLFVKFGTRVFPFFLPGYLFQFLPGLCHLKVYARFSYPSLICLAPVAVRGMRWVIEQIAVENPSLSRSTVRRFGMVIMILVFWFEQGLPPFGSWPAAHAAISKPDAGIIKTVQQARGSVLELPFVPSSLVGIHLVRQTHHGKPLVIGEISRLQEYRLRLLQKFPSLSTLTLMVTESGIWSDESILAAAEGFAQDQKQLEIGVIIVSERYCVSDARRRLSLFVEKLDEGERLRLVYDSRTGTP